MEMDKTIRILQVTSGFRKGVSGGIASVLYNYCTASVFDDNFKFDYLALGYQTYELYRADLERHGGQLYNLDIHLSGIKQLITIFRHVRGFLKGRNYDIVHINSGALTQVLATALAVKTASKATVIVHSHSSFGALKKTKFREIIYKYMKLLFYLCADQYFACSELAAESMFPKRIIKKHKWTLIPNAIQVERFEYNQEIRKKYREEFGLQDKYVIGHVGRFNEPKNHEFLINVFYKVTRCCENAVLLLVGTGELQPKIKLMVDRLGISDKVIFAGQRRDVNCLLQAMDIFVFPSVFEGLPLTLVEAQTSGLLTVSSDRVPYEATKITDYISYLPLEDEQKWVDYICVHNKKYLRASQIQNIKSAGYEIEVAAENLKKLYMELI